MLNSDGVTFAVSVAGTLDAAPYKATVHWAAVEYDDDVLAAAGGAAGLTPKSFSDVTGMVAAYQNAYTPYVTLDGGALTVGRCRLNQ